MRQGLFEDRPEQLLGLPLAAGGKYSALQLRCWPLLVKMMRAQNSDGHEDQRAESWPHSSSERARERRKTILEQCPGRQRGSSFRLQLARERVYRGAKEVVQASDFPGEGRNEDFPIDGDAELGIDAVEDVEDMQRSPSILEYVECHLNFRAG